MSQRQSTQAGFTIMELMFATTAFSVVLLVMTAAVIQIGRMYYKGVITSRTQDTARNIVEAVSRPIQFSQSYLVPGPTRMMPAGPNPNQVEVTSFCLGTKRYTYALNAQVTDVTPTVDVTGEFDNTNHKIRHALWQDTVVPVPPDPCPPVDLTQDQPSTTGRELLAANMRLIDFSITSVPGTTDLWSVKVGVLYGEDDLIKFADAAHTQPLTCLSGIAGSQWCAPSILQTQVAKRLP